MKNSQLSVFCPSMYRKILVNWVLKRNWGQKGLLQGQNKNKVVGPNIENLTHCLRITPSSHMHHVRVTRTSRDHYRLNNIDEKFLDADQLRAVQLHL